ncbi:MAG: hypothetical protein FWC60_06885 [Firmicutes bacterium]|nr:hypothetical protein [Bacillota bacterium]
MLEVRCSRFEVRDYFVFVDPQAQARNTINRKRFLEEYERTVFSMFEVRGS